MRAGTALPDQMPQPKDGFDRFVAGVEGGRNERQSRFVDVLVVIGVFPGAMAMDRNVWPEVVFKAR